MKLTINKKYEETLLSREKIIATVEYENAVPARKDVLNEIAKKTDSKPELILVSSITPSFGHKKADVTAYVYKSKEIMEKTVPKKIITKTGLKSEKKAEAVEAPKEAAQ